MWGLADWSFRGRASRKTTARREEGYALGIKDKEEGILAERGTLEQGPLGVEMKFVITDPT